MLQRQREPHGQIVLYPMDKYFLYPHGHLLTLGPHIYKERARARLIHHKLIKFFICAKSNLEKFSQTTPNSQSIRSLPSKAEGLAGQTLNQFVTALSGTFSNCPKTFKGIQRKGFLPDTHFIRVAS